MIFLTDSERISELTFTNERQLIHADALEWRSHCSFPQALKEVMEKKRKTRQGKQLLQYFLLPFLGEGELRIFCYREVIKYIKKKAIVFSKY